MDSAVIMDFSACRPLGQEPLDHTGGGVLLAVVLLGAVVRAAVGVGVGVGVAGVVVAEDGDGDGGGGGGGESAGSVGAVAGSTGAYSTRPAVCPGAAAFAVMAACIHRTNVTPSVVVGPPSMPQSGTPIGRPCAAPKPSQDASPRGSLRLSTVRASSGVATRARTPTTSTWSSPGQ